MYRITIKIGNMKYSLETEDWETLKEDLTEIFKIYQKEITGYLIEKSMLN